MYKMMTSHLDTGEGLSIFGIEGGWYDVVA